MTYANDDNVVVVPFKIGGDLWFVDEANCEIICEKNSIQAAVVYGNGDIKIMNKDGDIFYPGEDGIFTTREEAEADRERILAEKQAK